MNSRNSFINKKITLRTFMIYFLVTFILLLQYKWFFIPSNFDSFIVKFNTDNSSSFIVLVIIAGLGYIIFDGVKRKKGLKISNYKFAKYVIFLSVFFVIQIFYTMAKYPLENNARMISSNLFYLVPLFYFILMDLFRKYRNGFKYFINTFTVFNIILCLLMLFASIYYDNTGKLLLNFYNYDTMTRNDSLRVYSGGTLISISCLISICFLFYIKLSSRQKVFHLVNIGVSLLEIIFILQTRTVIFIMICMILLAILFTLNYKKIKVKEFIFIMASGIFFVYFLLRFNIFSRLSFTSTEISYINREEALSYFFNIGTKELLGIGLLTDSNPIYATILHGPNLTCYISDVGIIGMFGKLGILSIIWYILICIVLFKMHKKTKNKRINKIPLLFFIFFVVTSFINNYVNYAGIFLLPVAFALCEFLTERECYR